MLTKGCLKLAISRLIRRKCTQSEEKNNRENQEQADNKQLNLVPNTK